MIIEDQSKVVLKPQPNFIFLYGYEISWMEIQLHLEIVHYMYFENGLIYTRYYTLQRLTFIARNLIPSNEKTQMTHDKKQDIAKIITHTNKLKKLQNVTFPWVFFCYCPPFTTQYDFTLLPNLQFLNSSKRPWFIPLSHKRTKMIPIQTNTNMS